MVKVSIETDSKVSDVVRVVHDGIEVDIHFYKQNHNLKAGIYHKNKMGSMKCIANFHENGTVEVQE